MCIAICKPEGLQIKPEYLQESFLRNPDGAGFAYAEQGQLVVKKGLMTYEQFQSEYEPHKEKAAIVHFRIKTHGNTDEENTHPFIVGNNLAMIHNGIISEIDCKDDRNRSDTYHFNTKVLTKLYKRDSRFIYKDHYRELIRGYIGRSKLVFINNKGHFQVINEQMGEWEDGIWYSNTSYKPMPTPVAKKSSTSIAPVRQPETFTQGDRVTIREYNQPTKQGTIMHFTGGLLVGVLLDGEPMTSLIHMSLLTKEKEPQKTFFLHSPFNKGDWVVRSDEQYKELYEVTGTSKNRVWVRRLGPDYSPIGIAIVVDAELLSLYDDTGGY